MPLYEYETIRSTTSAPTTRFHWRQRFSEPPLARHPETNEPVRRVITGGLGLLLPSRSGTATATAFASECEAADKRPQGATSTGGCGSGCGCAV